VEKVLEKRLIKRIQFAIIPGDITGDAARVVEPGVYTIEAGSLSAVIQIK
jgi:hypothetical protein